MEFSSDAQKQTYEKITPWLREICGDFLRIREDIPSFGVGLGSAWLQVNVFAWGENDATVNARAYVVTQIEIVPDLMKYLLQANDAMRFGAFGIDQENDIFFDYTVVGSTIDKEELKALLFSVLYTADEHDDKIIQKWGGVRAIDRQ